MNIYEIALEAETQSEKIYRDLSKKATNNEIRSILSMLADDEARHSQFIKDFIATHKMDPDTFSQTVVLQKAADLFHSMKTRDSFEAEDLSQEEIYNLAISMEKESMTRYQTAAHAATKLEEKKFLLFLSAEEDKHRLLIENMLHFVKAPKVFLDKDHFNFFDNIPA